MKPKKNKPIKVVSSSGNVFADLGLPNPEERLIKAQLAAVIGTLIDELAIPRSKTAALLGIDPPKVSMLLNGRLKDFSVERLMGFLQRLNRDIDIVIRPRGTKRIDKIIAYV